MVEVACQKCSASYQLDDADVPPSGKVMKCAGCGAAITVLPPSASYLKSAPAGRTMSGGHGDGRAPGPKHRPSFFSSAAPGGAGDTGDVIDLGEPLGAADLGDLPAPKRPSPLAGVTAPSRPKPPPSPLAAAGLPRAPARIPDIPGPRRPEPPSRIPEIPGPPTAAGVTDLPAPVRPGGQDIVDLPAPIEGPPGFEALDSGIDLPAPVGPTSARQPDLPAPKRPSLADPLPGDAIDLPAPVRGLAGFETGDDSDLLAPVGPTSARQPDLPAPKRPSLADPLPGDAIDLPAPVGPHGRSTDLPAPKRAADVPDLPRAPRRAPSEVDLPAPKRAAGPEADDLLAPRGFFDDLPAPGADNLLGDLDLLAPKRAAGPEVDDLLAPKRAAGPEVADLLEPVGPHATSQAVTPRRPGGDEADLPAPKSFFDDLPAPKHNLADDAFREAPASLDLDDFDLAPPSTATARVELAPGDALDLGAADAFAGSGRFDIGNHGQAFDPGSRAPAPGPDVYELDEPEAPASRASGRAAMADSLELDLGGPGAGQAAGSAAEPLELGFDLGPSAGSGAPASAKASAGALDLDELDLAAPSGGAGFESLDLAEPARGPAAGGSFGEVDLGLGGPGGAADHAGGAGALDLGLDDGMDLAEPPPQPSERARKAAETRAAATADAAPAPRRSRVARVALVALLAVVVLGAGGFYGYTRYTDEQARTQRVAAAVKQAEKALRAGGPGHWTDAARAAERALAVDDGNAAALGIAAQALYAAHLDQGAPRADSVSKADQLLRRATERNAAGPHIDKARALAALLDGRADAAAKQLRKAGKDAETLLYLGWAQQAARDHRAALATFEKALAAAPDRKVPALFGLAESQRALGMETEARASYAQLIEIAPEHIGALLGATQVSDSATFSERETAYLALLQRQDIDSADPRAVSRAWGLAGAEALRAGRLDEAKTRFAKALELDDRNLDARVGQARTAAAEQLTEVAREKLVEVLAADPQHIDAALALAEVATQQGALDEAQKQVDALMAREPPLQNKSDLARAYTVQGRLHERRDAPEDAKKSYEQAREVFGDDYVPATIALANLLVRTGEPQRAEDLLKPIEVAAGSDPGLAVTIGVAYLGAGKAERAETWFRKALEARPRDVEARFQLAEAQRQQGKIDAALQTMVEAYRGDSGREDIGIKLAMFYESIERPGDAAALYDELLAAKTPSINARARAGRFYARRGKPEKAAEQGLLILNEEPGHPAGLFLRGEGLYLSGDFAGAQRAFRSAVAVEPTPQFLDGLGRASEELRAYDEALRAYVQASEADPEYLSPLLGQARIRILQREFDKAVDVLEKARALAPDAAEVHGSLGRSYHEQGDDRRAVPHLKKAVRARPEAADYHYALGMAYFNLDQASDAAAALTEATRRADPEAPWLMDAYFTLGRTQYVRGRKSEAIAAYESFLAQNPDNAAEVREARRQLMRLRGH